MSKVFSRRTGIQSLASYVCFYVSERKIVIVKILNMQNIDMYLWLIWILKLTNSYLLKKEQIWTWIHIHLDK